MAIDDAHTIDAIGTDRANGDTVLSLIDADDWHDVDGHITKLNAKLATYIGFITSGQLYQHRPSAANTGVRIDLYFRSHPPNDAAQRLGVAADKLLQEHNISMTWRHTGPSDHLDITQT